MDEFEMEGFEHKPLSQKAVSVVIDLNELDDAIETLESKEFSSDISPFITALNTLKTEPENNTYIEDAIRAFHGLETDQGAVLTYSPYIMSIVSDDPFGEEF